MYFANLLPYQYDAHENAWVSFMADNLANAHILAWRNHNGEGFRFSWGRV